MSGALAIVGGALLAGLALVGPAAPAQGQSPPGPAAAATDQLIDRAGACLARRAGAPLVAQLGDLFVAGESITAAIADELLAHMTACRSEVQAGPTDKDLLVEAAAGVMLREELAACIVRVGMDRALADRVLGLRGAARLPDMDDADAHNRVVDGVFTAFKQAGLDRSKWRGADYVNLGNYIEMAVMAEAARRKLTR